MLTCPPAARFPSFPAAAFLLALVLATACADAGPQRAAEVQDWALEGPVVSIGVVEGDERYQFHNISSAFKDAGGRLVVLDGGPHAARIFDSTGVWLHAFASRGQGPGEVGPSGTTAFAYRGDSIAVSDVMGQRIAIFDAEGGYGRGIPLRVQFVPRPGTVPSQSCCQVSGVLEDGSFLVHPPDEIPNEAGPPRHGLFTLLRLSADGAVLDTLGTFSSRRYSFDGSRRRSYLTSLPFLYAEAGSAVIGGNPESNVLRLIRPGRGEAEAIDLELELRPFTPQVRQAIVDAYAAEHASRPEYFEGRPAEGLVQGESPEHIPAFTRLRVDQAGRVWAREWAFPFSGEPETWNVFDLRGRHLARIDLPGRSRLMWLGEDEVLVVVEDDLGVERLELYRIDTAGGDRVDRPSARHVLFGHDRPRTVQSTVTWRPRRRPAPSRPPVGALRALRGRGHAQVAGDRWIFR